MGAGHAYQHEYHMLIDEKVIDGTNRDIAIVDEVECLPLEEQLRKLGGEVVFGTDDWDEIKEMFSDDISEISQKFGENYDSISIEALREKVYSSDRRDEYESFKEELPEIVKAICRKEFVYERDFDDRENGISNFASIDITTDFRTNTLNFGIMSDNYNSLLVTSVQTEDGSNYIKSSDYERQELVLPDYNMEYLHKIMDNVNYVDSLAVGLDFVEEVDGSLTDNQIDTLFGKQRAIYTGVVKEIAKKHGGRYELEERCKNDALLHDGIFAKCKLLAGVANRNLNAQADETLKKIKDFSEEFFCRAILSYEELHTRLKDEMSKEFAQIAEPVTAATLSQN